MEEIIRLTTTLIAVRGGLETRVISYCGCSERCAKELLIAAVDVVVRWLIGLELPDPRSLASKVRWPRLAVRLEPPGLFAEFFEPCGLAQKAIAQALVHVSGQIFGRRPHTRNLQADKESDLNPWDAVVGAPGDRRGTRERDLCWQVLA